MQSAQKQVAKSNLLIGIFNDTRRVLSNWMRNVKNFSVGMIGEIPMFSKECTSTVRLDSKTAVITGCNTGIGKITAKDFFQRGARVIMACRNIKAANEALKDIKEELADLENCGEIEVTELDLSSLESVRKCAKYLLETEEKIDLLINNAGVMMCPFSRTEDGFELQFATNHLGHFLLTLLLLPKIVNSKPSRIVTVSSLAHEFGHIDFDDINWEKKKYSALGAYEQSKLANVLFSKELARRLAEANIKGVNTYSLHPGVIATDLSRHINIYLRGILNRVVKTPKQGAQTTIYCAVDEKCENETGLYYSNCRVKELSDMNKDDELAEKLWQISCALVKFPDNSDLGLKINDAR